MDPWKTATAALGSLSAVLAVALVVVWSGSTGSTAPPTEALSSLPERSETVAGSAAAPAAAEARAGEGRPTRPVGLRRPMELPADGSAPAWVSDPSAPLPDEVLDRAREQLRDGWQARRDERRDEIRDEIDTFLEEEGIDPAKADRVHELLDTFGARMEALRDQVRSGELDRMEARSSSQEGREELSAAMDEALGPDTAARLRERMPGPGGGRGMGPGRGGGGL